MATIGNYWTGDGLSNGVAVTTGNVNTAGNSVGSDITWAFTTAGGPTVVTAGNGLSVVATTNTMVGRIDGTFGSSKNAIRGQIKSKIPVVTTEQTGISEDFVVRAGTATIFYLREDASNRVVSVRDANNSTNLGTVPAMANGDVYVVRFGMQQDATTPGASNGRIWYRVDNLTNTSWNTTGYYYYSSGFTINLSTTAGITVIRAGKTDQTSTMPAARLYEFIGAEGITVPTTDTSEAALTAWLADIPAPANSAPVGTITANQNKTASASFTATVSATDPDGGTLTYAWSWLYHPTNSVGSTTGLTGATTATVSGSVGSDGFLGILRCIVTEPQGLTLTLTTELRVLADGEVTILPLTDGTGDTGWTLYGTGTTQGGVLSDGSATSGVESPDFTGTASKRRWRYGPMKAKTGYRFYVDDSLLTSLTAHNCKLRVYSGSTLVTTRATSTLKRVSDGVTVDLTASAVDLYFDLTSGEITACNSGDTGNVQLEAEAIT